MITVMPEVDPVEFFNDWMMRSQNAANPSLIMQYATRSGEAVDWFLEKCLRSFWRP